MRFSLTLCLACLAFNASAADDTIYLEETVITGNQELPKVLYILPWRDMDTALLPQRAFEYTAQSVLVPVYPEEQRRELNLRQVLRQARSKEAAQSNLSNPNLTPANLNPDYLHTEKVQPQSSDTAGKLLWK